MFKPVGVGKGVSAGFVLVGEKRTGVLVARIISGVMTWGELGESENVSSCHGRVERMSNPQATRSRKPMITRQSETDLIWKEVFLNESGIFGRGMLD